MAPVPSVVRRGVVLPSTVRTRMVLPRVRSHQNARHRSHRGCVCGRVVSAREPDCYPGDCIGAGVAVQCRVRVRIDVLLMPCVHIRSLYPIIRSMLSPPPFGGTGGGLGGAFIVRCPAASLMRGVGFEVDIVDP